jgi:hypothetical protein
VWSSDNAILIGWTVLLAASVMLAVGWHSRIAALLVFVLVVSFERRSWFIFNAGDGLIRIEALLLMVSSCGAALSLDRRRRGKPFWSAEIQPRWALRLLQIQLSLIYLSSVLVKMLGDSWPQGTAVSYALRLEDMLILRAPQWISDDPLVTNVLTWATLALEFAIGILVWSRRLRWWVLGAGVVMHVSIMVSIGVGFFTPAMLVLYLAFVPPSRVHRVSRDVRRLLSRVRDHRNSGTKKTAATADAVEGTIAFAEKRPPKGTGS